MSRKSDLVLSPELDPEISDLDRALSDDETVIIPWTRSGPLGRSTTTGVFVVSAGRVRCRPAVDVTRLGSIIAFAAVAITGIRAVTGSDSRPAVGPVTMGPGGWLSVRSNARQLPVLSPQPSRPWWAKALRARRLVVET